MRGLVFSLFLLVCCGSPPLVAQDRATKVRGDRTQLAEDDLWVYNDLSKALAEAKRTNRPLMVVFRCIPCEACSQFDKKLLERPEEVKELLTKFVCVRIVQANGLDLSLFQFDFDQSFHVFFLHADKTILGRYGTRSNRPEEEDMTIASLRQAMLGALDLHRIWPQQKENLAGKQSPPSEFAVPEEMPALKGKYTAKLDYEGEVMKSCIHCHQVRDAERTLYRSQKKPMPDHVLYPFPLPEVLGLRLDPQAAAKIVTVTDGSFAAKAGLQAGDELLKVAGQPLISIADLQWALHRSGDDVRVPVEYRREGKSATTTMHLPTGWKQTSNISWRATTWELRALATGGMLLSELTAEERAALSLRDDQLGLRIKHLGLYGRHAGAKNAGFEKGDVLVAVEGNNRRLNETEFIAFGLTKPAGAKIKIALIRGKERMEKEMPVQ